MITCPHHIEYAHLPGQIVIEKLTLYQCGGVALFLIPTYWNFTQCWFVATALEKRLVFIVMGGIIDCHCEIYAAGI